MEDSQGGVQTCRNSSIQVLVRVLETKEIINKSLLYWSRKEVRLKASPHPPSLLRLGRLRRSRLYLVQGVGGRGRVFINRYKYIGTVVRNKSSEFRKKFFFFVFRR